LCRERQRKTEEMMRAKREKEKEEEAEREKIRQVKSLLSSDKFPLLLDLYLLFNKLFHIGRTRRFLLGGLLMRMQQRVLG
jgi:hypothetical protein